MDWNLLQWPAMLVTVWAAWLVSSENRRGRNVGFWLYLSSNVLWVAWGWLIHGYALILLQAALAAMNIRGARKTES